MILTTEQLNYIKKLISDLSIDFGDQKIAVKDYWQSLPQDNKDSLQRGIFMGKSSAYDYCYQRVLSIKEKLENVNMFTLDKELLKISETIKLQSKILEDLANDIPEEKREKILDQTALLTSLAQKLERIFDKFHG